MKITKARQPRKKCSHVTQPGELTISFYDGKQCTNYSDITCNQVNDPGCELTFCYMHWPHHFAAHR